MKRFLIVEDDMLSCKILEDVLSRFAKCDTALDGATGFEMFERAIIEGQPYDLICTDIVMPGIDGHEFVRQIRAREESLPVEDYVSTKIFVISSNGTPEYMLRALLDNECTDYIVKPFRRESLIATLKKYDLIEITNEP